MIATSDSPAAPPEAVSIGDGPSTPMAAAGSVDRPAGVCGQVVWPYAIAFLLFHAALPLMALPWLFSWTGLLMVPLGNYIFCSTGIGLCYHRTLTHRGLVMPKWLEHSFATLGVCSLMDSPARWVAVHRRHHQHSDHQPDPHTPKAGFWWSHFEWLLRENAETRGMAFYEKYARDVLADRYYMAIERYYLWAWIYGIHAALFFATGLAIGWATSGSYAEGVRFGASLLFWGVVVRTVYTWHITWAVNSITHTYGYRNYETSDSSTNHWAIAVLTNGEGWHNNHHAEPRAAAHGHRWWEFDMTWNTIRFLKAVGLAKEVVEPRVWKKAAAGALRS
ncbi:Fatty acid desaturase [Botrimarina colliarenosi]|uniref:Fatty acid desaturase n=1 Tax=Botrimarina colliarenosi TaxID=2528001 RepID=A0A5C6ACT8_9BACT|nr:fatty acid desaturase [Botrimarina colliarenosi]TWT96083.1 Fatty acid desaturase [Botrimarina colliarenosi]